MELDLKGCNIVFPENIFDIDGCLFNIGLQMKFTQNSTSVYKKETLLDLKSEALVEVENLQIDLKKLDEENPKDYTLAKNLSQFLKQNNLKVFMDNSQKYVSKNQYIFDSEMKIDIQKAVELRLTVKEMSEIFVILSLYFKFMNKWQE